MRVSHCHQLFERQLRAGRVRDVRDHDHSSPGSNRALKGRDNVRRIAPAKTDINHLDPHTEAPLHQERRHHPAGVLDVAHQQLIASLPAIAKDRDVHPVGCAGRHCDLGRHGANVGRDCLANLIAFAAKARKVVGVDARLGQIVAHLLSHRLVCDERQRATRPGVQVDGVCDTRKLVADDIDIRHDSSSLTLIRSPAPTGPASA